MLDLHSYLGALQLQASTNVERVAVGTRSVCDHGIEGGTAGRPDLQVGLGTFDVANAPSFGQAHCGACIDLAKAIVMACVHATAVPVLGAVEGPVRTVWVIESGGRQSQDGLDVAIPQVGVGLQHQGNDARNDRCSKACPLCGTGVSTED